jgi:hypothetical protein
MIASSSLARSAKRLTRDPLRSPILARQRPELRGVLLRLCALVALPELLVRAHAAAVAMFAKPLEEVPHIAFILKCGFHSFMSFENWNHSFLPHTQLNSISRSMKIILIDGEQVISNIGSAPHSGQRWD